ncbi:MAG TPA: hypothetical protein VI197_10670 [Polyangiaceae bacterium]
MRDRGIREVYEEAQRLYPELSLGFEAFHEHCAALHLLADPATLARYGTDLFLSAAAALAHPEAVAIIERRLLPAAAEAIARVRDDAEFVEEAQRGLRQVLLYSEQPKIMEYSARSSLLAWIKVVATRYALQRLSSRESALARKDELTDRLVQQYFRGDTLIMSGKHAELFQRAFSGAVSGLDTRDRNVLRMHLVGNCSPDQIGRAYSVHRATAAGWLKSTKKQLVERVSRELRAREAALSDEEFESLSRLVRSQLDLTFANSASDSSHASNG